MLFPPKGSGLEIIKKKLEDSNFSYDSLNSLLKSSFERLMSDRSSLLKNMYFENAGDTIRKLGGNLMNAAAGLKKNLPSSIGQVFDTSPAENYNEVLKNFLPGGSKLTIPEYPQNSSGYFAADFDENGENEIAASYTNKEDTLNTFILKKENGNWNIIFEISHDGYKTLHYRNVIPITGKNKKQLVLGLGGINGEKTLFGYNINRNGVTELFSKTYHKLEVLGLPGTRTVSSKSSFALWSLTDDGTYDISLYSWVDSELVQQNPERYFFRKVLPLYARNVKSDPGNQERWYELADVLIKAGAHANARSVIEAARKRDIYGNYKERYESLIRKL